MKAFYCTSFMNKQFDTEVILNKLHIMLIYLLLKCYKKVIQEITWHKITQMNRVIKKQFNLLPAYLNICFDLIFLLYLFLIILNKL